VPDGGADGGSDAGGVVDRGAKAAATICIIRSELDPPPDTRTDGDRRSSARSIAAVLFPIVSAMPSRMDR
jgi:hypothetical protein